ncbi:hypothetical protein YH65_00430 [Sulfurovum lithotrophicum]|uniref:Uncharacterized protein n=1 Tax=Sulfurovum lithotrophicum TaxID=206403 RepID=A0A7U4RPT9_9BACT|nr:hypothetical protein [Sulfurovum lithotrophicum]AKF24041.1 hypothetical protein YH65_00430 [Sulfurovum lithotrophicum]
MKKIKFFLMIVLLIFMISEIEAKNYPNNYKAGYRHGCLTAQGTIRKDKQAYNNHIQYRKGWNTGFKKCKKPIPNVWNSYNKGYKDGCSSARGRWVKNVKAYNRFTNYRRGWNAGFKKCKKPIPNVWNSYNKGYKDGCSSARGRWVKNVKAYNRFTNYRRGWNAGFKKCKKPIPNVWNSYNKGYKDGCSSARGRWVKNVKAYNRFTNYRRGWNAGKRDCRIGIRPIVIPPVPVAPAPVINIPHPEPVVIEKVQIAENPMIRAAKDFILAKYIHESPVRPIGFSIRMNKSNMKYGALEFTIFHKDDTHFVEENLTNTVFLLCFEKTQDGWEVINDLTGADTLDKQKLLIIKNSLPEDFPLDLLPTAWIDLFDTLDQSITGNPGDQLIPGSGSV